MSNHRNVAVLSHHQPVGSRTGTFIPPDVAHDLVQRMAAERISSKVIRMLRPDSVFLPAIRKATPQVRYIPTKLPPREVENCKFIKPPQDKSPTMGAIRAGWKWLDFDGPLAV